jgi:hypothetical protein
LRGSCIAKEDPSNRVENTAAAPEYAFAFILSMAKYFVNYFGFSFELSSFNCKCLRNYIKTMKYLLFSFILILLSVKSKAQTEEQINSKSRNYIENRSHQTRIRSIPADSGSLSTTENQLIVIDNKIYKGTDTALRHIIKDSLRLQYTINDETSKSGTRQILVYKTKKSQSTK